MNSPAVLELSQLGKRFDQLPAVVDLSLKLFPEEVRCIIGPNGSGKTTTFNLISGVLSPSAGSIYFGGRNITHVPVSRRAAMGIARSFQTPRLLEGLTVFENVRVSVQSSQTTLNPLRRRSQGRLVDRTWAALDEVGLAPRARERAENLSHGERAWLQLALIAARPSSLVLLDEPTAGMNQQDVSKMLSFLSSFRKGRAIIVVEHDMDFVIKVADTITVLNSGAEVMTGTPDEVRSDETVRAAYLDDPVHRAE